MEFNIEHTYKPTLNVYTPDNASYIPTRKTDDCQGRLIESEKNIWGQSENPVDMLC